MGVDQIMNKVTKSTNEIMYFETKYAKINRFFISFFVLTLALIFSSAIVPSINSLIFGTSSSFGTQQILIIQLGLSIIMLFTNHIDLKRFMYVSLMVIAIFIISLIGLKMGVPFDHGLIVGFMSLGFSMFTIFYFKKTIIINLIILMGIVESLIGLIQHFFNITIFSINTTKAEVYHSIFFSHGSSASAISKLGGVANIRAFGMMDSGLSLGIFCLFCICLILCTNYTKFKSKVYMLFFLLTIYSTITRNVYFATVLFAIFFLNRKKLFEHKQVINIFYIVFLVLMACAPLLQDLIFFLTQLAENISIQTFGGRFSFLSIGISEIPSKMAFLFGSNIVPNEYVPLDNSFIADMLRRGLAFSLLENIMLYVCFYWCLKKVSFKDFSMVLFMSLYPFIGFSNNVTYSFLILFSIISIFINNKKSLTKVTEVFE